MRLAGLFLLLFVADSINSWKLNTSQGIDTHVSGCSMIDEADQSFRLVLEKTVYNFGEIFFDGIDVVKRNYLRIDTIDRVKILR